MRENKLCKRTNILSERDFAQMDRKVKQKPNISTFEASGLIMYLNNNVKGWIDEKEQEEQAEIIAKAVKLAPERIEQ